MLHKRGFTLLELLVVASIIAIIAAIAIPQLLNARRSAWENRAKLSLRAVGSCQLAYADANLLKCYGPFPAMCESEYIQTGFTRGNMIDNYSLAIWHCAGPTIVSGQSAVDGGFTIVAIPRSNRQRLRTFAICDDQVLRVATDRDLDVPPTAEYATPAAGPNYNPCGWEPLR